jgi:hypothetical protein
LKDKEIGGEMSTDNEAVEKIGDDIYEGLREVERQLGESLGKKGFITDTLSKYLYELGYIKLPDGDGWELYEILMDLTVLNQNAPKIILTNDEAGWLASYLPEPPTWDDSITVLGGNPLDVIRVLDKARENKS